jgi:hypothetical protein
MVWRKLPSQHLAAICSGRWNLWIPPFMYGTMALPVALPLTSWRKSIRIERHGPGQTLIVPQENF